MSEQFQALPIDDQRAAAAYPLVYLHDASITTEQWLSFVRCRRDSDLRVQRRLCITDLIVAHLPGVAIDDAVAASARRVSAELDCGAITIERPFLSEVGPWGGCPTAQWLRRQAARSDRRLL
jgi:hypothetical protein